jgi:putative IMPACT (imprinted ancient) family translation regulator
MTGDSYNTITKISEGLFKDKGSKFIAKAFPVETEEEVKIYLEEIKKRVL